MDRVESIIADVIMKPHVAGLATMTEKGTPWVRNILATGDQNFTLRFATGKKSRKVSHILNNNEVHLSCGANSMVEFGPYLQVQGIARVREDQETKQAFWYDELLAYFSGADDPNYVVVEIEPQCIECNLLENPGQPMIWQKVRN